MKSSIQRSFLTKVLAAALVGATVGSAAATPVLAPHRAVYDVRLKEASDRSGIQSMNGRIVYEFRGSVCDGYTTQFRFVSQIGVQGDARVTDQQTTTFEAGDGSQFRFVTKTFVNNRPDREVSGNAELGEEGIAVELTEPDEQMLDLDVAKFPSQHMKEVLERAANGETFFERLIFDGSEDGDKVVQTTVIIGQERTEETSDEVLGELAGAPFRTVNISYFDDPGISAGEVTPNYTIGFRLHENGVTRNLTMDYGDFELEGQLSNLELFEPESCE
ncbi:MAG: cell envelope integrity EipB family protein [Pseudomonadota bacterium]